MKSSLGRRSSMLGRRVPGNAFPEKGPRNSSLDRTTLRSAGDNRKRTLLQPGFIAKPSRSSSADKLLVQKPPGLTRSKSYASIDIEQCTPRQQPTGNFISSENSARSTISAADRRGSSYGGVKSCKKEQRPIMEKGFQAAAQRKVQSYFMSTAEGAALLEQGSIKPMTVSLFVDLVDFLIKIVDKRIIVTKANFQEQVQTIGKLYFYRGKVDRSWLISLNTPHSWPHVVGFLVWLVELCVLCESLNVYEAMYPQNLDFDVDSGESNDMDFRILVPHLINAHNINKHNDDPEKEHLEIQEFVQESADMYGMNEGVMKQLEEECDLLENEINNSKLQEDIEILQQKEYFLETLQNDLEQNEKYIRETRNYIEAMKEKKKNYLDELQREEKVVEDLVMKVENLRKEVSNQKMSLAEKQLIETKRVSILSEIHHQEACCKEYSDLAYSEDIKIGRLRNKLNQLRLNYNKMIVGNVRPIPELNQAVVNTNVLHEESKEELKKVDELISELTETTKMNLNRFTAMFDELKHSMHNEDDKLKAYEEQGEELINEIKNRESRLKELKKKMQNDKEAQIKELKVLRRKLEDLIKQIPDTTQLKEKHNKLLETIEQSKWELDLLKFKSPSFLKQTKMMNDEFERKLQEQYKKVVEQVVNAVEEMKTLMGDDVSTKML